MSKKKDLTKANEALERLVVEYRAIADITPNAYNPNRQDEYSFDLLVKSITEDGFTQPIVVDPTYTIVDGEHRWRAAAHLGMTEVPVVVVPMDAAQARIATLRHNRARGAEQWDLTAAVFRDLEKLNALDWAQDSLKMSAGEVDKLLQDLSAPAALMAEEYSEAWVPDRNQVSSAPPNDGNVGVSATPAAIEAARDTERRMAEAKTQEERQMAAADRGIYRIHLTFGGDEAGVVKEILGPNPAEALLILCQQEHERRNPTPVEATPDTTE